MLNIQTQYAQYTNSICSIYKLHTHTQYAQYTNTIYKDPHSPTLPHIYVHTVYIRTPIFQCPEGNARIRRGTTGLVRGWFGVVAPLWDELCVCVCACVCSFTFKCTYVYSYVNRRAFRGCVGVVALHCDALSVCVCAFVCAYIFKKYINEKNI